MSTSLSRTENGSRAGIEAAITALRMRSLENLQRGTYKQVDMKFKTRMKRTSIRTTVCALVWASAVMYGGVTVRPEGPLVVAAGSGVQFRANGEVHWSLEPGSVGEIDRDGVYHAPQSIPVKNSVGGCQLLPNDHVFNTRVDSLPLDPKSAYFVSLIPPTPVSYYEDWGINIADRSTPTKRMHFAYTPQNDGVYEHVPWPELKRQTGVFADPRSGVDAHELTVDRDSCRVFELYNAYEAGFNKSCATCTAQSGITYSSIEQLLPTGSVNAAGLLAVPLTPSLAEIHSGAIQHALVVTLRNSIIGPSLSWPARASAGAWGHIPYGTRFRLKSSYDISRFSETAKVLLRQLQQYGLIVADGGADWAVSTSTDVTLDPVVLSALDEVYHKGPRSSDFEVVDESSLMVSADSGLVNPDNGHMKPDSFAIVVATDAHGNTGRVRIILKGVTVGVPAPSVWIQSGVAEQLVAWVNGADNKELRWSMDPLLGQLTTNGNYTAPAVTRPTQTTLTAASVADPNAKAEIVVTIMPPGPIRVKIGDATKAAGAPNHFAPDYGPDSEGNMWWRDQAGEVTWGVPYDDGGDVWPNQKDIQLFYTSRYSFGDMVYKFFVPNGKYKITLLFAQPGGREGKVTYPKEMRAPIHLEAQGKLLVRNYDMGAGIGYARKTPVIESLPADVTDQSLYFALRRVCLPNLTPSPLFNGFIIEPDTAPPHISIVPSKVTSVHIGDQIQLKTLGWSLPDDAQWAVIKGRGTVTPDGLFTAPPEPPSGDETIVVEARSKADPSKTAHAEMVLEPGDMSVSPSSASIARSLTQQFKAFISGAAYANVNWSISPNVGSIGDDGLYKAPDQLAKDTTVIIKAESRTQHNRCANATLQIKAVPDTIRVNCGGGTFKDTEGNTWAADHGASGGMVFSAKTPIPDARPDILPLYQSSRYVYPNDKFSYRFVVPNGKYKVTLKFSDYVFDTPGHHVFDVKINGSTVLTNFDANAVSKPRAAIDKTFETSVDDKSIAIEFLAHAGGAIINGIEIQYAGPNY